MKELLLRFRAKVILTFLVTSGFVLGSPGASAQEGGVLKAWASIQQSVKDMETAVRSKNLHGIHDPSMKIRGPIRTLKGHSTMLSGDQGQKVTAALKQLDNAVTDLHSAADEGDQAKSEAALKGVESAFDELKGTDPGTAFKGM